MKALYFDCSSGICGNMTLGALLDIIDDEKYFLDEINKINIDGYKIEISKRDSYGITGRYVDVIIDGKDEYGHEHHLESEHHDHEHNHEHPHHHEHRNLNDVNKIIDDSTLSDEVKDLAKKIFLRVAMAESKVHNKPLEEVHFHEVGALDSIIDIIGTAILIKKINPEKIISSVVNDGYGFIECAHGRMSVPVPATSEIVASSNIKLRQIDIPTELVTPTGAAIIAEIASDYTTLPVMKVEKIGWGAGTKDTDIPNVLKVFMGETEDFVNNKIVVMETNIDDSSAEVLGYCMERLMEEGAQDVFFTPIYMKKSRPAYRLTVCTREEIFEKLQEIIFKHTTTIGIRYRYEQRTELPREVVDIETKYGKIKAKKVRYNDEEYIYPEYESLKEISDKEEIPIKDLYKLDELK